MAEWYVKQLSELTHISVQTLHHYDRIGLLKRSVRLPNGYRLYSEKDLLKLQQIIAFKFFGFELADIKHLLTKEINLIDHLSTQSERLYMQAKTLLDASDTLKKIIADCRYDKSLHFLATLDEVGTQPDAMVRKQWEEVLFDMCGNDSVARQSIFTAVFAGEQVKLSAKEWVKKFMEK